MQHRPADSQWWSAEKLLTQQLDEASRLLAHSHRTVPWYRERIEQAGITPGGPLSLTQWQALQPITRAEVQPLAAIRKFRRGEAGYPDGQHEER